MRISDWSSDVCSSDLGPDNGTSRRPASRRPPDASRFRTRSPRVPGYICWWYVPWACPENGLPAGSFFGREERQMRRDGRALDGRPADRPTNLPPLRSAEHTSELQSKMRISYSVFTFKKT